MTPTQTARELMRLAKDATEGPWANEDGCQIISTLEQTSCFVPFPVIIETLDHENIGTDQAFANADYIAACDPQTIIPLMERLIQLEGALERYRDTQLLIRSGDAIVQIKNGHGEWINTVPLYADETWTLGDIATEALKGTNG